MTSERFRASNEHSRSLLIILLLSLLLVGAGLGYLVAILSFAERFDSLQKQISTLQYEISGLRTTLSAIQGSISHSNVVEDDFSLSELYEHVRKSVVLIRGVTISRDIFGRILYSQVQGSGFICNITGRSVIITNCHVVKDALNITVTFHDGNAYAAMLIGSDPYADLAVLSTEESLQDYPPLKVVSSSTLKVGDTVIAVGSPFGLVGSMVVGIVSALGRAITEELSGSYAISPVIQTTAPLNPGNSGGPLLNLNGEVIGIATAIVADSQGLGFAIPSNTILREIAYLVNEGSYNRHPWLGIEAVDMTFDIAKVMNVNVTYGCLITRLFKDGPAEKAGLKAGSASAFILGQRITIGGDIIIAINGSRIINTDDLSSYLEEKTSPGDNIIVTVVRGAQQLFVTVQLGTRPPPS
ncbi:MAG: trypsin-like peptidase domain-containing protein [Nitrososphaerota archaeon]|nr:trypsin-like peptidase domain-containing protein [Candidatus Bathyarchaeota archaeon]MDW8049274.1 trypsin-like peptidase domain-containing protein [Nitrososphaerota archaeon]